MSLCESWVFAFTPYITARRCSAVLHLRPSAAQLEVWGTMPLLLGPAGYRGYWGRSNEMILLLQQTVFI